MNAPVPVKDKTDYSNWSKEDLISKIRKLEIHVQQLRNVIAKKGLREQNFADDNNPRKRTKLEQEDDKLGVEMLERKEKKIQKKFDFSAVTYRHVALKFLYLGWDYQGLAVQEDSNETIEDFMFKALKLTRLIEDRTKSNYHRCGRTDKGVSSFSQVISIDLRSKVVDGKETVDYCKLLNNTLPKEIRVVAWSPVRPDFSARFNCCRRTYRYFFPRGNLNTEKMVAAAQYLLGEHDFRNFCKINRESRPTVRKILSVEISPSHNGPSSDPYEICYLKISGESFVWHQIRCIVGVLLLIGKNLEQPEVIKELLDIEKYPQKPQYSMAVDYPLVLYDADYPAIEGISWTNTSENMTMLLGDLEKNWIPHVIKSEMIKEMITDINKLTEIKPKSVVDALIMGARKIYVKLRDLPVCLMKNAIAK